MSRGIIWDWGVPRTIQGYWDMGRITIPPLPPNIVLTDRGTGALWLVEYNAGSGLVGINSVIPSTPDKQIYASGEEPYVGDRRARLIVRDAELGFDWNPDTGHITDQEQGPLYIRVTGLPLQVVLLRLKFFPNSPNFPDLTFELIAVP